MPEQERSTLADVRPSAAGPRPAHLRRILVALLVAMVAAGATGLLGVRTATASATQAGHTVSVTYASVARAGLDVPWSVEITRVGGFDGPVTVAVTGDYLDIYEEQGLDPEPVTQTADATTLYWTFAPPPGDVLAIDLDAYIQPSSQLGADGEVAVVDGGVPVAAVPFRTWLVP